MKIRNKFQNLLEKDYKIVEKRKIIFVVPLVVLVVAAIMMIIFRFTSAGSALNLGTDFTGGYSIDVQLGNSLTDGNYQTYYNKIEEVFNSVEAENGRTYKVKISGAMQRQGSGDKASIHVKYAAVTGVSESDMRLYVNPALKSALERKVLNLLPVVRIDGNTITAEYKEVINNHGGAKPLDSLRKTFLGLVNELNTKYSANISDVTEDKIVIDSENPKQIIITSSTAVKNSAQLRGAIETQLPKPDSIAGTIMGDGNQVSATVSTELLFKAILAVVLALIFMLCYIGLRFQLSSGIACIIALFHDILIMFGFMAIFHIEINSTFIAALITILGYSINNSIILFDRVRENMRTTYAKSMSPEQLANKSIRETLLRSINTTITTLIMILMVAIIGVTEIRIFALPIIAGLIAGTYSSIFIAPSLWALFQRIGKNRTNFNFDSINKSKKTGKKDRVKPTKTVA